YGSELDGFLDIDTLGGLVIKAVTADVRAGNPAPRVAEFDAGMLNSVGLANPGPDVVLAEKLPWLAQRLRRARVFVNIAGRSAEEYGEIIRRVDAAPGFHAYELNVSCPHVGARGACGTRESKLGQARAERAGYRAHGGDRCGCGRRRAHARDHHARAAVRPGCAQAGARGRGGRNERAGPPSDRRLCRRAGPS